MIFAKVPEAGKVKTRLAETIGDDKALQVYLTLLQHTHDIAAKVEVDKLLFYEGDVASFDMLDYYRIPKTTQQGDGLGERMNNAFIRSFSQGYEKVIIMGSDCYELSTEIIEQGFKALDDHDFVIGPAADGGYYMLGMRSLESSVFDNKTWSGPDVCLDTILDLKKLDASYSILPTLSDVDYETDMSDELKDEVGI
jgi:hypothetical protein